ncbi:hypothetical protein C8R41DRAFT_866025 [Lentinula lateritia]|uniref:Non-specific serine/threonine protein kinase n=1 Tax=Lentinula lateritia TaxID=40482 RepID=A0ABQ8VN31_9AGAR|nr:hypothetical protein C8R41DRAFT_866025 [Lentinula lateritia]
MASPSPQYRASNPVLACVVDTKERMRGFLIPFGGTSLDHLPTVRWQIFFDILQGLVTIHAIPADALGTSKIEEDMQLVEHGDICARNVLVDESGKVHLIDVGSRTVDYQGDRRALVDMMAELRLKAETEQDETMINRMLKLLEGTLALQDIITSLKVRT